MMENSNFKENIDKILDWIKELNSNTKVSIVETNLKSDDFWFFDKEKGVIRNRNDSFFEIIGIKGKIEDKEIEQPIILQKEIGYLGILCKKIDGITKYLMQAKIEPGNVNCVQISPTIQATKSNFTQKHGGNKPLYLEYFINANKYNIIADQIQSEQSSRFLGKRNRNMIIEIEEDIEVYPRFRWMTLNEIKQLMRYRNLVNMDTRTVISCLPLSSKKFFDIDPIYYKKINEKYRNSLENEQYSEEIVKVYHKINNYKMFSNFNFNIVPLNELNKWNISSKELSCKKSFPFKVIFCDIEIEGREVKKWTQPLFKSNGKALFGLIIAKDNDMIKILTKIQPEIGCFDMVELGPTVQREFGENFKGDNVVDKIFNIHLEKRKGVIFDSILSEEGGRFYHEENRNVIILIENNEIEGISEEYQWLSYKALMHMNMFNNSLNIQLRNLLSVIDLGDLNE